MSHPQGDPIGEPRGPMDFWIRRPQRPGWVEVRIHGDAQASLRVWFIRARIDVCSDGPRNPLNRRAQEALRNAGLYHPVHGYPNQCGRAWGVRPGEGFQTVHCGWLVEYVGVIEPQGVPSRFYFTRRARGGSTIVRANGHRVNTDPVHESDDTTCRSLQDREPQSTTYRQGSREASVGLVFDTDAPGFEFDYPSPRGGDRGDMNVSFVEVLAIGDPDPALWDPNAENSQAAPQSNRVWEYTQSNSLRIAEAVTWTCRLAARLATHRTYPNDEYLPVEFIQEPSAPRAAPRPPAGAARPRSLAPTDATSTEVPPANANQAPPLTDGGGPVM